MISRGSVTSFSVTFAALVVFIIAQGGASAETEQERVHEMSHDVMPFDMSKTVHVFEMTESGGIQRVVARDASDAEQVGLIRQHLKHEAGKFDHGDYSDPARLHGAEMPGLAELQENASAVDVSYSELPAGGQLRFEAEDWTLVTAIHRWFGAQLSDHGADARAE